jgi:hypothetical protein
MGRTFTADYDSAVRSPVLFIPIITTVLSLLFAMALWRRWRMRGGSHLLWWCAGLTTYAAGTLTESLVTLLGWSPGLFRAWYITGALLGGAPLAQGTVYLLLPRPTANRLTALIVPVIAVAAVCVLLTPIDYTQVEPYRLTGRVMQWQWVRAFSPFINLYAVVFLIGGAILSALRFRHEPALRHRFIGNVFIAIGAILPGIGGTFTRFGHTEVLYVTELIGLVVLYIGYRFNIGHRANVDSTSVETQRPAESLPPVSRLSRSSFNSP